ncbi:MAG: hypothetical protein IT210_18710 [Armatimonadetes bacterium]|nr:hypothetical protein [Armatimonadota bacterium]
MLQPPPAGRRAGGHGFLSLDIFPENQVANGSLQARHWARAGKPFDIMNSAFLKWWGEWGIKPVAALRQECATILANGGKTWIGYQMYPDFTVEPALLSAYKKTFDFVREREPLLEGSVPDPYLAVLHSTSNDYTHGPALHAEHTALLGAHRMLTARGLPYHALGESVLEKTLSDYRAVLLCDQRFLSESTCQALRKYVAGGGCLIATGLTATQGPDFRPTGGCALGDVLGIAWEGAFPQIHAYIDLEDDRLRPGAMPMPLLAESAIGLARPTAARPLAALRAPALRGDGQPLLRYSPPGLPTGYPAVTLSRFGAGQAVYIAPDIAAACWTGNQWNLAHLLENLLHGLLIATLSVRLQAPGVVEVALARQGRRRLIHLINHAGERPAMHPSHTVGYAMTEDVLPIHRIGVTIHSPADPAALTWEPGGSPLAWTRDGEFIRAVVERLELHG